MALVECQICGKSISSVAPRCPHCARAEADRPIKDSSAARGRSAMRSDWTAAGLAILLVILVGVFIYWPRPPEDLGDEPVVADAPGENNAQSEDSEPEGRPEDEGPRRLGPEEDADAKNSERDSSKDAGPRAPKQHELKQGQKEPPAQLTVERRTDRSGAPVLSSDLKRPAEQLASDLLRGLCNEAPRRRSTSRPGEEPAVICDICPDFTTAAGERSEEFELVKYIPGRFFGDGREQLVAYYSGCEPHSANFGGRVVFERAENRWKPSITEEGAGIDDACLKFAATTDRDELVCAHTYMGWGDYLFSVHRYSLGGGFSRRSEITKASYHEDSSGELNGERFYGWALERRGSRRFILHMGVEEVSGGARGEKARVDKFSL